MKSLASSCEEFPTSFAFIDTFCNPNKVIGHVLVEKSKDYYDDVKRDRENLNEIDKTVEFDLGELTCKLFL